MAKMKTNLSYCVCKLRRSRCWDGSDLYGEDLREPFYFLIVMGEGA